MVEVDDDEEEEEVVALEPDDAAAMEDSDSAYEPSESDVDGSDSDDSIPRPFRRAGNAMAVAVVRPNVPAEVDDVVDDAAPLNDPAALPYVSRGNNQAPNGVTFNMHDNSRRLPAFPDNSLPQINLSAEPFTHQRQDVPRVPAEVSQRLNGTSSLPSHWHLLGTFS